LKYLYITDL